MDSVLFVVSETRRSLFVGWLCPARLSVGRLVCWLFWDHSEWFKPVLLSPDHSLRKGFASFYHAKTKLLTPLSPQSKAVRNTPAEHLSVLNKQNTSTCSQRLGSLERSQQSLVHRLRSKSLRISLPPPLPQGLTL